jgi:hypothetical protein
MKMQAKVFGNDYYHEDIGYVCISRGFKHYLKKKAARFGRRVDEKAHIKMEVAL